MVLGAGPVSTENSKMASEALKLFARQIRPLTLLIEAQFDILPPEEFDKYEKIFEHLFPELQD